MSRRVCRNPLVSIALAGALGAAAPVAAVDPLATMDPLSRGPYAVACSNLEQRFDLAGSDYEAYWEGRQVDGRDTYVTDLLVYPEQALVYGVDVPDERELYPRFAGDRVAYAALVCYPTSSDNPRPDYPLPNGLSIPHMERYGDAPLWPDAATRFPVMVYAHGLGGSPLGGAYLLSMLEFARWGYVVVAPFFADARASRIEIEDLGDLYYLIANFGNVTEMMALRPWALSRVLDALLARTGFAQGVDAQRVGGFGASLGGQSLMLMAGAKLTVSVGLSSRQVLVDPRLKAMVGYVPYSGLPGFPSFGRGQSGVDGIAVPWLGMAGTADVIAPLSVTQDMAQRLGGTRFLAAIEDLQHGLPPEAVSDLLTWTVLFLDANVLDVPEARARLARLEQVRGGLEEEVRLDYLAPLPPAADEGRVVEFFNTDLRHYFMTASRAEADFIDGGGAGPGWERTGYDYRAWTLPGIGRTPLCRFYGTPGIGPNSHFYTAYQAECDWVKMDPGWTYEGLAFRVPLPVGAACPAATIPVFRAYNQRYAFNDSNHRYTTSRSVYRHMVEEDGWVGEGTVFCALP